MIDILGENKSTDSETAAVNMTLLTQSTKIKTFKMRFRVLQSQLILMVELGSKSKAWLIFKKYFQANDRGL